MGSGTARHEHPISCVRTSKDRTIDAISRLAHAASRWQLISRLSPQYRPKMHNPQANIVARSFSGGVECTVGITARPPRQEIIAISHSHTCRFGISHGTKVVPKTRFESVWLPWRRLNVSLHDKFCVKLRTFFDASAIAELWNRDTSGSIL
jgi:hypothetical protein